jgi:exodeoxyribonuclease V gamma subunit
VIERVWPTVDVVVSRARDYLEAEPRSVGINVALPDGRMLMGSVSGVRGRVLLGASYSRVNARHRISAWVRLLALTAADPSQPYEAVTVGKPPYGTEAELLVARIAPVGASRALEELARLAALRDRGLRDVLPLPPLTAAAYAAAVHNGADPEAAAGKAWTSGFKFDGEDVDPDHVRAFGGVLTLPGLLAIGPRGDEPDGSRLAYYAGRLWNGLLEFEELIEQ